jgi:hypothetical protein
MPFEPAGLKTIVRNEGKGIELEVFSGLKAN